MDLTHQFLLALVLISLMVWNLYAKNSNHRKDTLRQSINFAILHIQFNLLLFRDIFYDWLQARHNKTELPKMPERIAIVTGGTRGIGLEIVRMLLQCDMEVIIACRNLSTGEKAIKTIRESGVQSGKAKVMKLDNSSLKSVKKFVLEFQSQNQKLDILINNAGILMPPNRETEDGFEPHYGINYLSHFLLTILLIPLLKNAGTAERCSRIVNVSSCIHEIATINFDDINNKENFISAACYGQSKLAQVMFTKSLAKMFVIQKLPITIHAVHPGIVNTDIFKHENSYFRFYNFMTRITLKNPKQGATSIVYAAVSPKIEKKSGLYLHNCIDFPVNPLACDEVLQDRLIQLSLKQVQLRSIL